MTQPTQQIPTQNVTQPNQQIPTQNVNQVWTGGGWYDPSNPGAYTNTAGNISAGTTAPASATPSTYTWSPTPGGSVSNGVTAAGTTVSGGSSGNVYGQVLTPQQPAPGTPGYGGGVGAVLPQSNQSAYGSLIQTTPGLIGGYSASQRAEADQYLRNAYLDAEREHAARVYDYNSPYGTQHATGMYMNGTQPWANSIQTVAQSQNFQGLTDPRIVGPGNLYDTSQWYTEGWGSVENGNIIGGINNPYVPQMIEAQPVTQVRVPGVSGAGGNASGLPGVWNAPNQTMQPGYQYNQDASTSPFSGAPIDNGHYSNEPDWGDPYDDPRAVSGSILRGDGNVIPIMSPDGRSWVDPLTGMTIGNIDAMNPIAQQRAAELEAQRREAARLQTGTVSGNPLPTMNTLNYESMIPGWEYIPEASRQAIINAYQYQAQPQAVYNPYDGLDAATQRMLAAQDYQNQQWQQWAVNMQDPAFAAAYNQAMNPTNYNAPVQSAATTTALIPVQDNSGATIYTPVDGRYVNPSAGAQQTSAASMEIATRAYEDAMRYNAMRNDPNNPMNPQILIGQSLNNQAQWLSAQLYAAAGANLPMFTRY